MTWRDDGTIEVHTPDGMALRGAPSRMNDADSRIVARVLVEVLFLLRKAVWVGDQGDAENDAQSDAPLDINPQLRTVTAPSSTTPVVMRVPRVFGEIRSAERRGAYIVVITEGGRVSFHTPGHRLGGKMHWHSIRKALRAHCLIPSLGKRVAFHITHSRFPSGGLSQLGAGGHITVDGQKVLQCCSEPSDAQCRPSDLGAALAEYLFLDPEDALRSSNVLIASVALLDRRVPLSCVRSMHHDRFSHPLWASLLQLRYGLSP